MNPQNSEYKEFKQRVLNSGCLHEWRLIERIFTVSIVSGIYGVFYCIHCKLFDHVLQPPFKKEI